MTTTLDNDDRSTLAAEPRRKAVYDDATCRAVIVPMDAGLALMRPLTPTVPPLSRDELQAAADAVQVCTREPGHEPPHRDAQGREWTDPDPEPDPLTVAETRLAAVRAYADALANLPAVNVSPAGVAIDLRAILDGDPADDGDDE